jgi:DNA-binding MarR family transcriptional regulator
MTSLHPNSRRTLADPGFKTPAAYSDHGFRCNRQAQHRTTRSAPCKPRLASRAPNCFNLKENRRFDLRQAQNYLKLRMFIIQAAKIAQMILDSETKAVELPEHHGDELRLWLRLLTCTTLIEGEVRSRLRERFDVTLPRFDLMAQLDKVPEGMTLSDVSKRMMVSNGNVTGLVERLVESGHLDRRTSGSDRRVQMIRLTRLGRAEFRKMAAEHELWIADLFSDLSSKDVRELMRLLAKAKASATKASRTKISAALARNYFKPKMIAGN